MPKTKRTSPNKKLKELDKLARMAHARDKFDADSRAFRDAGICATHAFESTAEGGTDGPTVQTPDVAADPAQAMQDAATARAKGFTRMGGFGMVTTAINAAANSFPRMPATWFPVCGGGTGQATRTTRPASQTPAGPAAPIDNRRRRRTEDGAN